MSKNKNIIRIGDKVEIIKPDTFIRCGYPMTTQDIIEKHITEEQKNLMSQLMGSMGYAKNYMSLNGDSNFDNLQYVVARLILKAKGWGGRERTVHTKNEPEFLNCIGIVNSKKYVKTGKYHDSSCYQGWEDDYPEYEPAYLENEKTVIIYNINISYKGILGHYREFPQASIAKLSDEDYYEILNKTTPPKSVNGWWV